jgi:hypothetical protein
MEARRRTVVAAGLVIAGVLLRSAQAMPLEDRISNLFGGALATSITPRDLTDAQRPRVADRFRGLSAALAVARSQVPVPSATGAFGFELVPEFDAYVRVPQSLGPLFAERAQTLGRSQWTVSVSYTHIDFDTLDGTPLSDLHSSQPALSDAFLAKLPTQMDRKRARDNVLDANLDFGLQFDLLFLTAAYGVTDKIDVSATLSINSVHMRAAATAMIRDPNGDGGVYFSGLQPGVVVGGSGPCKVDFTCARDHFDDSATGTGDLWLRGKWHLYDAAFVDLALAGVLTLPTGNADDFLGFHDPTFTPWLIASKTFGRVAPHLNLGYAFRSQADVSQAQWIAGADVQAFTWLTLAGDFLGYHDDGRNGINDNVLQSAVSFRVNLIDQLVLGGAVQFPLNRDGLRADVIYTAQVEDTF